MNILYNCDDKYCPYTGISITSLFENNKELKEINVYIAGLGISEDNKSKLQHTAEKYGRTIELLDVSTIEKFLSSNNVNEYHGSKATLYRVFIDQLIPSQVSSILYIDSDTIVIGYLGELECFQFANDKACAMVRAPVYNGYNSLIGIKENALYYCAGVTLFDIENWRKLDCSSRLMQSIKEGHANYLFADQDLLCRTINENIQTLDPRYDVFSALAYLGVNNYYYVHDADERNFYSMTDINKALKAPTILHCSIGSSGAPWQKNNKNPFKEEWNKYKGMSFWNNIGETEMKRGFSQKMQDISFKLLPRSIYFPIHKWYSKLYYKRRLKNLITN